VVTRRHRANDSLLDHYKDIGFGRFLMGEVPLHIQQIWSTWHWACVSLKISRRLLCIRVFSYSRVQYRSRRRSLSTVRLPSERPGRAPGTSLNGGPHHIAALTYLRHA